MDYFIFGAGGFGREVLQWRRDAELPFGSASVTFVVDEPSVLEIAGAPVIATSAFDPSAGQMVVAVGDPAARESIVARLPPQTVFGTLVHPRAVVADSVTLGEGCIVCPGAVLTCDIQIGRHAQINLNCTVGHDCRIGDFFTAAPSANLSGNCVIGDRVYVGTGAALRERVRLADNVTVGMGAMVVRDIDEAGVYVGIPARRLTP